MVLTHTERHTFYVLLCINWFSNNQTHNNETLTIEFIFYA